MRINDNETQAIADLYREMIGEQVSGKSALTGQELVTALVTACMSKWYDLTSKFQARPEIYDVAPTDANDSYNVMKLNPGSDVRDDAFEAIVKSTNDIAKELNRLFGKDVFEPRITRQHGKLEALVAFSQNEGGVFQAKGEATEGHTTIHITMPKEAELERAFSAMTDTPHHGDADGAEGVGDMDDSIDADPIAGDPSPDYDPEFDVASDADQNEVDAALGGLDDEPSGDPMDDLSAEEADAAFEEPRRRSRFEALYADAAAALYESNAEYECKDAKGNVLSTVAGPRSAARKACREAHGSKCVRCEQAKGKLVGEAADDMKPHKYVVKDENGRPKYEKSFPNKRAAEDFRDRQTDKEMMGGVVMPAETGQNESTIRKVIDNPENLKPEDVVQAGNEVHNIHTHGKARPGKKDELRRKERAEKGAKAKTFREFVDDKEDGTPGFEPNQGRVRIDMNKVDKLHDKFRKAIRKKMINPEGGTIIGPNSTYVNGVAIESAHIVFYLDWEKFETGEFEGYAKQLISHWKKFIGGDEEFDVTPDPLDVDHYRLRGCEYEGLAFDVYIRDGHDDEVHIDRIRAVDAPLGESYIFEGAEGEVDVEAAIEKVFAGIRKLSDKEKTLLMQAIMDMSRIVQKEGYDLTGDVISEGLISAIRHAWLKVQHKFASVMKSLSVIIGIGSLGAGVYGSLAAILVGIAGAMGGQLYVQGIAEPVGKFVATSALVALGGLFAGPAFDAAVFFERLEDKMIEKAREQFPDGKLAQLPHSSDKVEGEYYMDTDGNWTEYTGEEEEVKEEAPAVSVGGATAAGSSPAPDVVKDIGKKKKTRVRRRNESVDAEMDAINEALKLGRI
jgi:hypothetical protein